MKSCFASEAMYALAHRMLVVLFPLILSACGDDNSSSADDGMADRTVLVWLAGDNDLSSEVPRKVAALAQGFHDAANGGTARAGGGRLIIYADRRGEYPCLYEVTERGELTMLETYPPQNSASGETLRRMLTDMMARCPARRYGLIVFSHATGWLPQGALDNLDGFADASAKPSSSTRTFLDDNGTQMSLGEFADSLPLPPDGRKYDYIVFESCFTAGVEVAFALGDKAARLLVSAAEVLSPGFEEVYPSSLGLLLGRDADVSGFARAYFESCDAKAGAYRSATVSVIRTDGLGSLAEALDGALPTEALDAAAVASLQRFNRHDYGLFFDLEESVERFAPQRAAAVSRAIDGVVEYAAATPWLMQGYRNGFAISRHCGLTVYLPQADFPLLNGYWEARSP